MFNNREKEIELIQENSALKAENELLKVQLTELKQDKENLSKKLDTAYELVAAIRSPEAYSNMKADLAESKAQPLDDEELRRRQLQAAVSREWIENLEKPLFKSKEEMEELLKLRPGEIEGPPSLHRNSES